MLFLRLRLHRRRPRSATPGFAMPLAIGASGLLLLGSFALHGVAMQESLAVGAMERQQREEDLLASAAHQLLALLNSSHRCLLNEPLAQWEVAGAACNTTPAAVAVLKNAQVMAKPVQLVAWQPGGNGQPGQLALQLEAGRQARYGVRLAAAPTEGAQLGPKLLGGVQP
jgi:hypothetical protein